jgi:hypothetical protein
MSIELIEHFVQKKEKLFPDDNRFIIAWELIKEGNRFSITIGTDSRDNSTNGAVDLKEILFS